MGQLKSERSRGKSEEDGRSYVVSKDQARGPAGWQGQAIHTLKQHVERQMAETKHEKDKVKELEGYVHI